MKQDWEDLGSEYEGSSSVLIGDVDCTVHSGLCSKHGVQGYPTIKYYKDGDKNGESYNVLLAVDRVRRRRPVRPNRARRRHGAHSELARLASACCDVLALVRSEIFRGSPELSGLRPCSRAF